MKALRTAGERAATVFELALIALVVAALIYLVICLPICLAFYFLASSTDLSW